MRRLKEFLKGEWAYCNKCQFSIVQFWLASVLCAVVIEILEAVF